MMTLKRPTQSFRTLMTLGFVGFAGITAAACTTGQVPEATNPRLPEELATTAHVQTFGVIEDDLEAYQWTGERFDDPRFAAELSNSPLNAEDDYRPLFSEAKSGSSVNMTKASKKGTRKAKKSEARGRRAR